MLKRSICTLTLLFAASAVATPVCPDFLAMPLFKAAWPTAHYEKCDLREVIPDATDSRKKIYALRLEGESAKGFGDKKIWFEPYVTVSGGRIVQVRVGKYKSIFIPPFTVTKGLGYAVVTS